MNQTERILRAFKQTLKAKGITYKDLSKKVDLSESSLKRILSSSTIDLFRLEKFCDVIDLPFSDLFKASEGLESALKTSFSSKQEEILSKDLRLFHFFDLLFEGKSINRIMKDYVISNSEVDRFLLTLDRAEILELRENRKFKMLMDRFARFQKDGPIGKHLFEISRREFLKYPFSDDKSLVRLRVMKVDKAFIARMRSKIEKLIREIQEEGEWNAASEPQESIGFLVALRPWQFTEYQALKKR